MRCETFTVLSDLAGPRRRRGPVVRRVTRPAVRPRMSAGPIDAAGVNKLLRTTDNWILTGSTMFRRECVTWAGGFDGRLGSFAGGFIARKIALR